MKESKFKLLIFDFDGTLADTKKSWYKALSNVFKKSGLWHLFQKGRPFHAVRLPS